MKWMGILSENETVTKRGTRSDWKGWLSQERPVTTMCGAPKVKKV